MITRITPRDRIDFHMAQASKHLRDCQRSKDPFDKRRKWGMFCLALCEAKKAANESWQVHLVMA